MLEEARKEEILSRKEAILETGETGRSRSWLVGFGEEVAFDP